MFGKRDRERLQELQRETEMLKMFLTVLNPGSPGSADAYDGLRKTILTNRDKEQELRVLMSQLHKVAHTADSIDVVRSKIDESLLQLGIRVVRDMAFKEAFQITGGDSGSLVVDTPAYIWEGQAGRALVIVQGAAHYEVIAPTAPEPLFMDRAVETLEPTDTDVGVGEPIEVLDESDRSGE